jgi:hypothetical protein
VCAKIRLRKPQVTSDGSHTARTEGTDIPKRISRILPQREFSRGDSECYYSHLGYERRSVCSLLATRLQWRHNSEDKSSLDVCLKV